MLETLPQHIGRYDIIRLLGEGGMARAYLAVSRGPAGFHKLAVIKQILPTLASDADFITMFLDEARLAARLHHPNIVQTFDVAEHDGSYLLAMEYLDGQSLSHVYRRVHPRTIPLETHLWILTEVLSGLHYAHTLRDYDGTPLGVVHRDVSPGNILVTYAGEVKLLDFGVAKARGALGTEKIIKGKPGYCAPEQMQRSEPDARADVFAVGVMLWEALAGRRLNRGSTLLEVARVRLAGKEPKIRDVRPDVNPELADICDRALAVNPAERFATAAEFQVALQEQLNKLGTHGKSTLVTLMENAFLADRSEVRKLIERRLAGTSAEMRALELSPPGPPPAAFPPAPMPPPPIVELPPIDLRPRSYKRLPTILLLASAAVAAFVAMSWLRHRGTTDGDRKPISTPAAAPLAAPAPGRPGTDVRTSSTGTERPSAQPSQAEARAEAPPAAKPPTRGSLAAKRSSAKGAAKQAMAEPAASASDAPASRAAAKRWPASEESEGAVAPGTHLLRPSTRPAHGSIDEKDPYSP